MDIFPSTFDDIPQLVLLINRAYRGDEAKQGWTHEADLIAGIERTDESSLNEMISDPETTILKYVGSNFEINGCVYLQKRDHQLYLGMLTVDPLMQDKGIGKKLLSEADKYALEKKCSSITMNVISIRKELINWYRRHGYYDTGRTKPFPSDERFGKARSAIEFMIMEKKIYEGSRQ